MRAATRWWWVHPVYFGSISLLLFPSFHVNFTHTVTLCGYITLFTGILLACWARTTLGEYWSPHVEVFQNHQWVSTGPYRYLSHPIYDGELLATLGTFLMTGHYYLIFALSVLIPVLLLHKGRYEEKLLCRHIGPPPVTPLRQALSVILRMGQLPWQAPARNKK